MGKFVNGLFANLAKQVIKSWHIPIYEFRKSINLPKGGDPIFEQLHSPFLSLSLFSSLIAKKQPDWPANNIITGFCFYDEFVTNKTLDSFIENGDEPILFTLGSAAVNTSGDFYEKCMDVIGDIEHRAILLVGNNKVDIPRNLESKIFACNYAPYNEVFKKCKIIVNQGGIGTVAQTMRAGKPMIGVPFSHDQPDNCFRIKRIGMGEVIYYANLSKRKLQTELLKILEHKKKNYFENAQNISSLIKSENGIEKACNEIESLLNRCKLN
jgi:UDP:flavonoid glycosyltransferase YjiC (YdhE family)